MDILLIHHIENKWERELNSSGTSVHYECYKILQFLKRQKNISEVILTKAEDSEIELEHLDIVNYCIKKDIPFSIKQYRYGWIKNKEHNLQNFNKTWCYASRFYYDKRDILLIPDWIIERKDKSFFLNYDRKYLYSFQGAYDKRWYLTDIREKIFFKPISFLASSSKASYPSLAMRSS